MKMLINYFPVNRSMLCAMCRRSDILCSGCQRKLENGEITQTYVDLVRAMNKIDLDATFLRSIDSAGKIFIIADNQNARKIVGKQGKNVNNLSSLLKKKIQIIKKSEEKEMIVGILGVPIIGINILYGSEEIKKVRIEKTFKSRIKATEKDLEEIMKKKYQIIFE